MNVNHSRYRRVDCGLELYFHSEPIAVSIHPQFSNSLLKIDASTWDKYRHRAIGLECQPIN